MLEAEHEMDRMWCSLYAMDTRTNLLPISRLDWPRQRQWEMVRVGCFVCAPMHAVRRQELDGTQAWKAWVQVRPVLRAQHARSCTCAWTVQLHGRSRVEATGFLVSGYRTHSLIMVQGSKCGLTPGSSR